MSEPFVFQPEYLAETSRDEGLIRGPDGLVHAWRTWRFGDGMTDSDEDDITDCGLSLSWFEHTQRGWVRLREPGFVTCLLCLERGREFHDG
jgi:hypothetical protein